MGPQLFVYQLDEHGLETPEVHLGGSEVAWSEAMFFANVLGYVLRIDMVDIRGSDTRTG